MCVSCRCILAVVLQEIIQCNKISVMGTPNESLSLSASCDGLTAAAA